MPKRRLAFSIMALATLVAIIPITISGLGTREAALIGLLSRFQVLPKAAVALSITTLIISLFTILIGAYLAFKDEEYL